MSLENHVLITGGGGVLGFPVSDDHPTLVPTLLGLLVFVVMQSYIFETHHSYSYQIPRTLFF
jgi:hypothetical protein